MSDSQRDLLETIGKHLSTVFIVLLAALFAYGYLGQFFG